MPASGQEFMCGPLSVEYMTIVLSAMPELVEQVEQLPTSSSWSIIASWYSRLPAPGRAAALRLGVGPEVHVGGVEPHEERLVGLVLALDEIDGRVAELVVDGLHPLLGQRAGVLDGCVPSRVGPGVEHAARAELLPESGILRVVRLLGLLLGVEVVEVAEELVEAVHRRQVLVAVAEVVLAELAGGVALCLQRGRRWSGPRPAGPASRRAGRPWSGRCGTGSGR